MKHEAPSRDVGILMHTSGSIYEERFASTFWRMMIIPPHETDQDQWYGRPGGTFL